MSNDSSTNTRASLARTAALWVTGCAATIAVTQINPASDLERGLLSIAALIGAGAIITAVHDHMAATRRRDDAAVIAERLEDELDAEIAAHLLWHARRDRATQSGAIAAYRTPETLAALEELRHGQDLRYWKNRRGVNLRANAVAQ